VQPLPLAVLLTRIWMMFVPTLGVGIKSPGVYAAQVLPVFVLYSYTSATVPVPPLPPLNVALMV